MRTLLLTRLTALLVCISTILQPTLSQRILPPIFGKLDSSKPDDEPNLKSATTKPTLRVMTFNAWNAGANVRDGYAKILKHIRRMNPEILLLQEGSIGLVNYLETQLRGWNSCRSPLADQDFILTQYRVTKVFNVFNGGNEPLNLGCQIEIASFPPLVVNVWSVHLYWGYYGPFIACDRNVDDPYMLYMGERAGATDVNLNQVDAASKHDGRLTEVVRLFNFEPVWNAIQDAESPFLAKPMIIGGDFNTPSHLDWTEENAKKHCGWYYQWPVSSLLEAYRFVDTYRAANPDPVRHPGTTWSSVHKYSRRFEGVYVPEPQDRIDYIYLKDPGGRFSVKGSWVYEGNETINLAPDYSDNDWPSDHAAVITDLVINV